MPACVCLSVCLPVSVCACVYLCSCTYAVSLLSPFYNKSMMRPVGREILLAQNDFMCQIFHQIAADHRPERACPKWYRLVNGGLARPPACPPACLSACLAFTTLHLPPLTGRMRNVRCHSGHARASPGLAFKCSLSLSRRQCVQLMCLSIRLP